VVVIFLRRAGKELHALFLSPTMLASSSSMGKKSVRASDPQRRHLAWLAHGQQLQLLGNCRYQAFQDTNSLIDDLIFVVLPAFRDQALHGVSRKVGDAAGAGLFTHADKLAEFVLRNPKIY